METTEKKYQVGDWVRAINAFGKEFTGYILRYDYEENEYWVRLTNDSRGKRLSGKIWLTDDQILPCRDLKDEDDILALIDLALDTNDKEWFRELTAQLPKELPF